MLRICALVALVARKHIEVCTVKPDSVFLQLGKIPFHIERCLRCTEIALRSARPVTVSRYRSIRKAAGIIFIVARRCMVIIAVLVVNTEFVAEIMYRQAISCLPIRRPLGMPVCSPDAGCHTPVLPSRPDEDRLSLRRDHEFRGSAVRARKTALRGYFSPDSADRKSRTPAAQPS